MSDTQAQPEAAPPSPPALPERPWPTNVVQAIARVMEEMPGVGKDGTAAPAQGGYAFRSIEAITAAAQHLMGRYGVVFVPRVAERRMPVVELQVGGKPWTEEQLTVIYTVYGPGGVEDRIEVGPIVALGRDNVDKGTNKCMTQAFKYALLQVLCIGDNKDDADSGSQQADGHGRTSDPEAWFAEVGWMDKEHHDQKRSEIAAALAAADSHVKTAFRKWYEDQQGAEGGAPAWREGWPLDFALSVENKLAAMAAEPATPPHAAVDGPAAPPAADRPLPRERP